VIERWRTITRIASRLPTLMEIKRQSPPNRATVDFIMPDPLPESTRCATLIHGSPYTYVYYACRIRPAGICRTSIPFG